MSKTTQRYGKPLYSMSTVIDGTVAPTTLLKRQWAALDTAALSTFGKPYDALSGKEKSELHTAINEQRQKKRQRRQEKELHVEARLDQQELELAS